MHTAESTRGRPLSDDAIIDIVSRYDGFRQPDSMTNEEFMQQFRKIVPAGSIEDQYGIVTPKVTALIYKLRIEYENHPVGPKGHRPQYSADSVRGQKNTGKINYLSDEEVENIFGTSLKRTSWLWLQDVLNKELGRWPKGMRLEKVKRKRGRPSTKVKTKKRGVGRPRKNA